MAKNKTNESLKVEKLDKNIEKCFVSRDLSWLEFNKRVLMLANDIKVPLVERLKFLSIYNSNLDEFFMVRVGSLSHRAKYLPGLKDIKTGRTADEEVKLILAEVSEQQKSVKTIYDNIIQDFKNEGIEKVNFAHLSKADETIVKKMFTEYKDFLSPRVIDNEHPIPFLTNEECYLAALLEKGNETKLGIVSLYRLPKYLKFESGSTKQKVVVVSELINYYIQSLFKKYTVREKCAIRVTRNADVFFEDYNAKYSVDSQSLIFEQCDQPGDTTEFFEGLNKWINDSTYILYAADIDYDPELQFSTEDSKISPKEYLLNKSTYGLD